MNISSKEIKKRDFKKVFRGYEPTEVDAFLDTVSSHFEKILTENKNFSDRIRSLLADIDLYRENEINLQKAIIKSQDLGEEIVQNARKKAELIIKEAELTSGKLKQNLEDEIFNKKQDLEEYKLKNDKIMDDVKNFLIEKLNELEDFVKNRKIIKMELARFPEIAHDTEDDIEQITEDAKKNMKKITLSPSGSDSKNKSFDDNFEVKQ